MFLNEGFIMNKFARIVSNTRARSLALIAAAAAPALSFAQEVDPFTTAVATITTKVNTYGAALVGLAAVGVVFMVGVKYVKKVRGAA